MIAERGVFMIVFKLKDLLKEKRISNTEFSEMTGISRTSLSQLANGKSQGIQFDTLERICLSLNVKPGDLFDIEFNEPEFNIEFVGVTSPQTNQYIVNLIYLADVYNESIRIGICVKLELEDSSLTSSVSLLSDQIVNLFVNENYSHLEKNNSLNKEHSQMINKALRQSKQRMFKARGSEYFQTNLEYVLFALEFVKSIDKNELTSIKLQGNFYASALDKSDIELYALSTNTIEEHRTIEVTYTYDTRGINEIENKNPTPIDIDVNTEPYSDYMEKFTFIQ